MWLNEWNKSDPLETSELVHLPPSELCIHFWIMEACNINKFREFLEKISIAWRKYADSLEYPVVTIDIDAGYISIAFDEIEDILLELESIPDINEEFLLQFFYNAQILTVEPSAVNENQKIVADDLDAAILEMQLNIEKITPEVQKYLDQKTG